MALGIGPLQTRAFSKETEKHFDSTRGKNKAGALVIEGRKESSAIEDLRLPSLDYSKVDLTQSATIGDPTLILNDIDGLMALPSDGISLPIDENSK